MSPAVPVPIPATILKLIKRRMNWIACLNQLWVSGIGRVWLLGAIEISGARYTRMHVPVQLVGRHKQVVVSHKKNIPGVRRQQLKSIANRSLSGNLWVVSETDSELASVAPVRGVFAPYPEGSLCETVRKVLPFLRCGRQICLKGGRDVKCDYRGVAV